MKAFLRGRQLSTVFEVAGRDENSATAALGWTLSRSRQLLEAFLSDALGIDARVRDPRFDMQLHGGDNGFTDIEIRDGVFCHVIVEAKAGWEIPSEKQLAGYAPRINAESVEHRKLVSLSAMEQAFVQLPAEIGGVSVVHRSWADIVRLINRTLPRTQTRSERLWLSELSKHLGGYMQLQDLLSSIVRVVPLKKDRISKHDPYRWVDVVQADRRYFHPVGGQGFPNVPQNYVGFRLDGQLLSVHFVEEWEIVVNLASLHDKWPPTTIPHFVYKLGPPMFPASKVASGSIYGPGSQSCAIDTLLSGRYATVAEAKAETDARKRKLMLLDDDAVT